jgi:hypothetical protein
MQTAQALAPAPPTLNPIQHDQARPGAAAGQRSSSREAGRRTELGEQGTAQAARDARPRRQPPLELAEHVQGAADNDGAPGKGVNGGGGCLAAAAVAAAPVRGAVCTTCAPSRQLRVHHGGNIHVHLQP